MTRTEKVLLFLLGIAFLPMLLWGDFFFLNFIQKSGEGSIIIKTAEFFSHYGRLEWSTLLPALVLFLFSLVSSNKKQWKRLSLCCLLGGILAGISVWPPKTLLGRERPYGDGNGAFHFLKFNSRTESVYHSMPSGHAASTMGSAWALVRIHPATGLPFFIASIATGWSRVKTDKHWPSDVLMGWLLGIVSTIPIVRWLQRKKR